MAEAARNVVGAGGRPLAITNCLNFGNPERPEIMWQFAEAVRGIVDGCEAGNRRVLDPDAPVIQPFQLFFGFV